MKHINIKIDDETHLKLKDIAKKECRSLKKQVEVILLKNINNGSIEQKQNINKNDFVNGNEYKKEEVVLDF